MTGGNPRQDPGEERRVEVIGTFDIFKIGVGPSSSQTMGPWRAAQRFLARCRPLGFFGQIIRVRVDLFGSLAKTGRGQGTDIAVMLGLSDDDTVTCDTAQIHPRVAAIRTAETIVLGAEKSNPFQPAHDLIFHAEVSLPYHPNALTFTALRGDGMSLRRPTTRSAAVSWSGREEVRMRNP